MKKIVSTIVLAFGLMFAGVPFLGTASAADVPCTTNTGPSNNPPCAPDCIPTVVFYASVISAVNAAYENEVRILGLHDQQAAEREAVLSAKIAHKNARIARLERRLAVARADG